MVPFRLTQNLVDAFGVSGYEGVFRRACEVTLQVAVAITASPCCITAGCAVAEPTILPMACKTRGQV